MLIFSWLDTQQFIRFVFLKENQTPLPSKINFCSLILTKPDHHHSTLSKALSNTNIVLERT